MSKRNLKARNLRPVDDPELAERMRELEQLRTEDHDAATFPFQGTSDIGVMPGPDTQPFTVDNVREIGYRTWDLRPVPPLDEPTPLCAETAEGWAHIFTITCHHCSLTGWNDAAATYDALYRSAWDAGWRQDKLRHWACRRCAQFNGQYEALWPVAVHARDIPGRFIARLAGAEGLLDDIAAERLLERTRLHYDASHRRGTHARQATA